MAVRVEIRCESILGEPLLSASVVSLCQPDSLKLMMVHACSRRERRKKEGCKKGWCERGELTPMGLRPVDFLTLYSFGCLVAWQRFGV